MPKREKGWSSAHDRDRKARHDFRNTLMELMLAVQLADPALIDHYSDELVGMYAEALECRQKKAA